MNRRILHYGLISAALLLLGIIGWRLIDIYASIGRLDFFVFQKFALSFIEKGILYKPDLQDYFPGSGTFKFPPLSGGILILLNQLGLRGEQIVLLATIVSVVLYFSGWLLTLSACRFFQRRSTLLVATVVAAAVCWPLFEESLLRLQIEILIFFGLGLSLFLLRHNKSTHFATLVGLLTALKLYPALLLSALLVPRQRLTTAIGGWMIVFILLTGLGICLTSLEQAKYYLTNILPILMQELPSPNYENLSPWLLIFADNISQQARVISINPPHLAQVISAGSLLVLLPLAWFFLRHQVRSEQTINPVRCCMQLCLATVCMLLYLKNSWLNYQVLLAPCAVFLGLWLLQRPSLLHSVLTASLALMLIIINISAYVTTEVVLLWNPEPGSSWSYGSRWWAPLMVGALACYSLIQTEK